MLYEVITHLWLVRRGQPEQVFSPKVAFAATFAAEALQMSIILLLARPFAESVALVQVIAAPRNNFV